MYPQSVFWSKNKKNRYTLSCTSQFCYIKVGFEGVYISRTCFPDVFVKVCQKYADSSFFLPLNDCLSFLHFRALFVKEESIYSQLSLAKKR